MILRNIHTAIISQLKTNYFEYINNDFINTENGLPTSILNFGFNCFFSGAKKPSINSDNSVLVNFTIQFYLDVKQDNYLDKIEETMLAIVSLRDINFQTFNVEKSKINWQNLTYKKDKTNILITYSDIVFEFFIK